MKAVRQSAMDTSLERAAFTELKAICPGRVLLGVPMSEVTTFRIGGPAEVLVVPEHVDEVINIVSCADRYQIPLFVMGRGSNLLVRDGGVTGMVMQVGPNLGWWDVEYRGDQLSVSAQAGLPLRRLLCECSRRGWGGTEFLVGIPGFLGGAVAMNAGTAQDSIGNITEQVTWVDLSGRCQTQRHQGLPFSYRKLGIPDGSVIVEAVLGLTRKPRPEVRRSIRQHMLRRKESQPRTQPCAGSIFKNPPGGFAGRIIEQLGFKGMAHGGAKVSDQHANFILNTGGAKAEDVLYLLEMIRKRVMDEVGIDLELEIQVVGEAA